MVLVGALRATKRYIKMIPLYAYRLNALNAVLMKFELFWQHTWRFIKLAMRVDALVRCERGLSSKQS